MDNTTTEMAQVKEQNKVLGPNEDCSSDRSRTLARPSSIKQRKESLGPFSDLTEHLHDILQDYGGVGENNNKLEAMEVSISRIEEQLHRLTEQLGKKDAS